MHKRIYQNIIAVMLLWSAGSVLAQPTPPAATAPEPAPSKKTRAFEPFLERIDFYEPTYFIFGPKDPAAKFQFSLKYQVFREFKPLTSLYFGFTQTSLWDILSGSSPFYDTSYKPSGFFYFPSVFSLGDDKEFDLDFQAGAQHESNGKRDPDSRSMNTVYAQPSFNFNIVGSTAEYRTNNQTRHVQFSITPRAWIYVTENDDNTDIANYRGYGDVRTAFTWKESGQEYKLAVSYKTGDTIKHNGVQIDFTMAFPWAFRPYLHAQYYKGYGETFLSYREKTDVWRFGISLYN